MGLYYNFFQPVFKTIEKTWTEKGGRPRAKRRYEDPQTPLDRLIATDALDDDQQKHLLQLRDALNVRWLKLELEDMLSEIMGMPNALPGEQGHGHPGQSFRRG